MLRAHTRARLPAIIAAVEQRMPGARVFAEEFDCGHDIGVGVSWRVRRTAHRFSASLPDDELVEQAVAYFEAWRAEHPDPVDSQAEQ